MGQSYGVHFTGDMALRPGRTYHWRVSAIVNGARVTSQVATFTTAADPFAWLADRGVSLTRAEEGVDKERPATVGFIRQGGDQRSQEAFAEFLLAWEGGTRIRSPDSSLAFSPSLLAAGKLSSDKEDDTLAKIAGGVIANWSFGDKTVRSFHQVLDVGVEGDQAFEDSNLLLAYLLTYSGPAIGRFRPATPAAPVQFFVRPYLLTAVGKPLDAPEGTPGDTQTRVGPQIDVKLRLNAVTRALGISETLIAMTSRYFRLRGHEREDAKYFTASIDFKVAKGITVGYVYKRGRDVPDFRGVNRMAVVVGVGFAG